LEQLAPEQRREINERMVSPNEALSHLPSVVAAEDRVLNRLRYGQLDSRWVEAHAGSFADYSGPVRIVTEENRLAALWWPNSAGSGSRRLRVFPF
jgi:tRNA U55 pseudouridine synthase TruB